MLGYFGFTGEPKQRDVNDSGMSWAERTALIKHIERT
jgi:hypothetical protein